MSKKSTIYEVAELAGVSIATVSRFMNLPDKVSAGARDRIVKAMEELSFVPKADAVARARNGARRIGVLAPYFTAPSFMQRLRGIQRALSSTKYDLITYAVDNREQLANYLAMLPVTNRIDGLIIMSLPITDAEIRRFRDNDIPVVSLENKCPYASSIQIDNRKGGSLAAECFIKKGYKRLGFVGESGQPSYTLHNSELRFDGYRECAAGFGIQIPDESILYYAYGVPFREGEAYVKEFLSRSNRPDALFFASDKRAMIALKVARQLGIRIPEELGIIGFDDIDFAEYMGLSTISQALDLSGETAAQLLMDRLASSGEEMIHVDLQLKLIERETT